MSTSNVIEKLKQLLADNYALYLKTQNYHWNVTGPNFKALHDLFEENYNDLFTANDDIAERIRTLGAKVPATFTVFDSGSKIEDGNENADAPTMVKDLADDQMVILASLKQVLEAAQSVDDEGTIDLISERISTHEKAGWMLRSSV